MPAQVLSYKLTCKPLASAKKLLLDCIVWLTIPVNHFSVMSGMELYPGYYEELRMCLALGHN